MLVFCCLRGPTLISSFEGLSPTGVLFAHELNDS